MDTESAVLVSASVAKEFLFVVFLKYFFHVYIMFSFCLKWKQLFMAFLFKLEVERQ